MTRVNRLLSFIYVFICMTFMFPSAAAYGAEAAAGPEDAVLSVTGDAETSVTVTWHDRADVSSAFVEYSTSASMKAPVKVTAEKVKASGSIDLQENVYSADIKGLKPASSYYYRISDDNKTSSVRSFTTSGGKSSDTVIAYFGDIQVEEDAEKEYDMWGDFLKSISKANPDISLGLFGGDIVQNGTSESQFEYFLENASPVFSQIPMMTTNGNHESNFPDSGKPELYMDMLSLPENGPEGFKEEFYSFDYGSAHVTVLNSWVFSGEQKLTDTDLQNIKKWLKDDLSHTDCPFTIVLMHHPVYALASDNVSTKVYEEWRPIFEENGVDLVLCGHQHVYARTFPLTSGSIDYNNGLTQIMGMSGQKFYTSADESRLERVSYGSSNCEIIRITGSQLTLTAVDDEGRELDYWTTSAHDKPGLKDNAASSSQLSLTPLQKAVLKITAVFTGRMI